MTSSYSNIFSVKALYYWNLTEDFKAMKIKCDKSTRAVSCDWFTHPLKWVPDKTRWRLSNVCLYWQHALYTPLGVEICVGWKQVWVRDNNNNIVKRLRAASSWIGNYINITYYNITIRRRIKILLRSFIKAMKYLSFFISIIAIFYVVLYKLYPWLQSYNIEDFVHCYQDSKCK